MAPRKRRGTANAESAAHEEENILFNRTNDCTEEQVGEDGMEVGFEEEVQAVEAALVPARVTGSVKKKRKRRKKEKDPIFKAILECAREKFWPVVPFVQDRYLTWGGAACRQVCKHCGYGEDKDEKVKKRFWEEKARPLLKEAMAQLRNGAVQRSKESFKAYYSSK